MARDVSVSVDSWQLKDRNIIFSLQDWLEFYSEEAEGKQERFQKEYQWNWGQSKVWGRRTLNNRGLRWVQSHQV